MPIEKLPGGTRGARTPPSFVAKLAVPLLIRFHRRAGNRFQGMDLLYLTTVGARSGERRTVPLGRFDDGHGGWLVVASYGGSAHHPSWYHNVIAHPDDVEADVAGARHRVTVEQLQGAERDEAWAEITRRSPIYRRYLDKTDRVIPILRLRPIQ